MIIVDEHAVENENRRQSRSSTEKAYCVADVTYQYWMFSSQHQFLSYHHHHLLDFYRHFLDIYHHCLNTHYHFLNLKHPLLTSHHPHQFQIPARDSTYHLLGRLTNHPPGARLHHHKGPTEDMNNTYSRRMTLMNSTVVR